MRENGERKKILKSLCACFLAFIMLFTNVMGAVEVMAAGVKAPTINPVSVGVTEITGAGLIGSGQRKAKNAVCNIIVTVKDADGVVQETKTFTIQPNEKQPNGSAWSVTLTNPVQEGYKIYAKQELVGKATETSEEVFVEVKKSLADEYKDKLKMPTGEFWIEQYVANILNDEEKAEALDLLKKANPTIAEDIKSVEFKVTGVNTKTASYIVTYTDDSKSEEIQAPDLTVKEVTEYSRNANLNKITVVDNVIKGKLEGEGPFDGIKVQLVLKVSEDSKKTFCNEGKCKVDKNSSDPVDVTVNSETGEFTYTVPSTENLSLDQLVGVSVKEKNKFVSCSTTVVKPATVGKTEVKDPRKLIDKDKKAIDAAIRKAYTTEDGKSKLPNGTGDWDGVPAVIQIDDSGNAKIFSGNDVAGTWDSDNDYKFVPEKNEDGSYKLIDGAEAKITIPAKDLVKNIKPEKPAVALSEDKKNITITPNEVDTDAKIIAVSYTGTDGNLKTTKATKDDNGTWVVDGTGSFVDGVFTLPKNIVKSGSTVTATVTDGGGIADDDKDSLTSDKGELQLTLTKAEQVKELGGLDPVEMKKWVGEELNWKDGVKASDSANENNKNKINEFLKEAKTTFADENSRKTNAEGDFEGKIKVTFDDDSFIEVEKQMLYISNHVTSMDRKEKVPTDVLDVQLKLGEGVKVEDKDPNSGEVKKTTKGNKDNPVLYKGYKVKPGTDLSTYKHPTLKKTIFELIDEKSDEGYTDPVWKGQDANNANNFVATADNNVFTAVATKTYKVTVEPNGGEGEEKVEIKKINETYTLPAKDTFTPPNDNQEFSGWQVGTDTTLKQPGDEIQITGDTTVKAIWKPIEFKVDFKTEAGASGSMNPQNVKKGDSYELPDPTFKPEKGKEFAGWKVGGGAELKQVGEKIDISGDVTLTAVWKDIKVKVTYDANGGSGEMAEAELTKDSTYKLLANGFTAPENKEFDGWMVGTEKKSVGDTITINGDTEVKAVWKDIEYKVTFNGTEGTGNMPEKLVKKGEEYTLPENGFEAPKDKVFDSWKVGEEDKKPGDKITVNGDTEVKAVWKDIEYKVTFDGTEGTGTMPEKLVKKGEEYTLPENGFEAPKDKVFDGWMVGTEKKSVGDTITVKGDTEVKAVWKDKTPVTPPASEEFIVSFNGNSGTGKMEQVAVKKGDSYKLPESGFTAPEGKEFGGWEVNGEAKKVGDVLSVNGNIEVKAVWKDKGTTPDPSKPNQPTPNAPSNNGGNYLILEKVEPKDPSGQWETGRHYKYLYGYPDGSVRPEGQITRAEAAGLIARLAELDLSNKEKPDFKDTPSRWYNSAINVMVAKDLMFGDKNGNFRPNEPITRGEFARALYYIDTKNDKVAPFEDVKGHEFEAAINQAYGNGRIAGYPDGSFKPDAYIQRAEAARMLNQYADRGVTLEGMAGVKKDVIRFTDINESHWAYYEVMEAANTHDYRRAKGRLNETWLRIIQDDNRVAR